MAGVVAGEVPPPTCFGTAHTHGTQAEHTGYSTGASQDEQALVAL